MRYLLIKNKKLYKLFFKFELKRLQYKSIMLNTKLPNFVRHKALAYINKLNKNSSYVNIKQRCFITNNGRSVLNHFKLSRIKLRLLISNNYMNGVKKFNK
jgi:small subunit ribosomal protein S14|uniref:Small ribosomal subunit protein uS14m n=1 Tax=Acanthamoeba castellanii TaxID=5755 RepID=A0A0K1HPB0_ACACA|nr:ribosomal protein S14 [Acanthamoeba castellanii]